MSTRHLAAAVVTACLAAGLLGGCRVEDGNSQITTADATLHGPVHSISIQDDRRGSISIHKGGSQVLVHRTVYYKDSAKPHPSQTLSGGSLVFSRGCSDCYIDYDVTVPTAASVNLSNSSGTIDVTDMTAAQVSTDSGTVTLHRLSGRIAVHASSGAVTGDSLSGSADVTTSSGGVTLGFDAAPSSVTARTSSGNVGLTVPQGSYRVKVDNGKHPHTIGVRTDPAASHALTVTSDSGQVTIS